MKYIMQNIDQIYHFGQLELCLLTTLTVTANMEGYPVLFNSDSTLTNMKCSLMPFSGESNPTLDVVKATITIKKKHEQLCYLECQILAKDLEASIRLFNSKNSTKKQTE
jgi:hypothetical protein